MFVRLYNLAGKEGNKELFDFCTQILEVYEKNKINCHIEWKRKELQKQLFIDRIEKES